MRRPAGRPLAAALGAALAAAPVAAARPAAVHGELLDLPLGGALVAALAPGAGQGLLVLVRDAAAPDGERRLLRLGFDPAPRFEPLALGLGGWIKALAAADLGAGPELVAAGLGRLAALGPLAAPGAHERALVEHPGLDLRSLAPGPLRTGVRSRIAAAEAGALRVWEGDGAGGLRLALAAPLPAALERAPWGLTLRSPPVAEIGRAAGAGPLWIAGPEPVGRTRLRATLVEAGGAVTEAWAALPGAETVERSWRAALDGAPVLVVRTQGAAPVDLLERQRLRVLPLAPDRTRAGAAPALAVELDARRWHDGEVLVADADGDGRDDLVAAYPEGLTGDDLVIQVWRGSGGGRFAPRAARSDVEMPSGGWLLVDGRGAGGPALLAAGGGRLELRRIVAAGRRALAPEAALAAALPPAGAAGLELLGVAELDGRAGPEALAIVTGDDGAGRLVVLRR